MIITSIRRLNVHNVYYVQSTDKISQRIIDIKAGKKQVSFKAIPIMGGNV